jgi:protein TonB
MWTLTAALLGQLAAGGVSALIPPGDVKPVPRVRRAALLAEPRRLVQLSPPRPIPQLAARRPVVTPKSIRVAREFDLSRLMAPASAPKHAAIIADEPPPYASPGAGSVEGVPGGIPEMRIEDALPGPPPPPAVPAEAAAPVPQNRIRIGGRLQAARLIHRVLPIYPPLARQAHIQGPVQLTAVVGKDGRIRELRVVNGNPLLAPAAMDAVRQWRYAPAYLNEQPVEVVTEITVIFTLHGPE